MRPPSRNKFGARKTVVDGIRFDSAREARRYQELCLLEKTGQIQDLALQVPFIIEVGGKKICTYRADFCYTEKGERIVEDVKGHRTREYILKKKLTEAIYGIQIREI
ncbi:MAG: DUF1064 domain-containing protein [Alphaproteobacteria bacterium]|uniref:DUF1064 domain-containing protein n=1 Tax=Candidatus Nitrobium versatile TaxID=2884831 RepID=A0A953SDZ0_9BACT|nr:DUF1064 domain-containing protein [Candidatus Nitrobium versatile]